MADRNTARQDELCAHCPARSAADPLTGLADRRQFRERLAVRLGRSRQRRRPRRAADRPRPLQGGERRARPSGRRRAAAIAPARRLRSALRPGDTAARLGGDEFAVLLGQPPRPRTRWPPSPRGWSSCWPAPMSCAARWPWSAPASASPLAPEDGDDPDTLLSRADLALYQSKAQGRGRCSFFEPPNCRPGREARRALELGLRAALPRGEFALHYQPQLDLGARRLSGFEALLRWQPAGARPGPARRVHPAGRGDRADLRLGAWVLRMAPRRGGGLAGAAHASR